MVDLHMMHGQDKNAAFPKIAAFDYKGGKSVTSKLCEVLHVNEYQDLAEVFSIPRGTVSTWHTRETTPYEIAIRAHLATGVSLKWLLLDEGEAFCNSTAPSSTDGFPIEELVNGRLETIDSIHIDKNTLKKYGLTPENLQVISQSDTVFFINTNEIVASNGTYLIDIDGSISINQLQRLPGKKLALIFSGTIIEITESEIRILGRVVMTMSKE